MPGSPVLPPLPPLKTVNQRSFPKMNLLILREEILIFAKKRVVLLILI